ncbi:MAG: hypothetical protein COW10_06995 [Candidatus Omnitrophica bacterium CG12_big_fil_rev_8_21_14_0_65_42_8]|nr:MAG: hypothetical protein COW10_06995 [Candidatus Omnitrophica bacterium CG12_big_fil_rev_8_21_14_0_65_42_8]
MKKTGALRYLKRGSFTLIELIVSVAILSVIVVSIYSVFSLGVRTWRRGNENTSLQKIRLGLLKMENELKRSFFFSKVPFRGTSSEIIFPLAIKVEEAERVYIVTYYIDDDKAAGFKNLMRREMVFSDGLKDEEVLEKKLFSAASIQFGYPFKSGDISDSIEWQDSWGEPQGKMPSGVRITFKIDDGNEDYNKVVIIPQGRLGIK